ncbi:hypothetical protein [Cellulomonas hominis]
MIVAALRKALAARTAALRGPIPAPGAVIGRRALSHYDEVFNLPAGPPLPAVAPTLQVVR